MPEFASITPFADSAAAAAASITIQDLEVYYKRAVDARTNADNATPEKMDDLKYEADVMRSWPH